MVVSKRHFLFQGAPILRGETVSFREQILEKQQFSNEPWLHEEGQTLLSCDALEAEGFLLAIVHSPPQLGKLGEVRKTGKTLQLSVAPTKNNKKMELIDMGPL